MSLPKGSLRLGAAAVVGAALSLGAMLKDANREITAPERQAAIQQDSSHNSKRAIAGLKDRPVTQWFTSGKPQSSGPTPL